MAKAKHPEIAGLYRRGKSGNFTWFYRVNGKQRTFASILLMKGAGIGQVAKALGDSEATVEEHYNHFIPSLNQAHLLYS